MSIVQNPLIGAARQKIGNAVFSTWKGIYVLKTKPLTVANPKTDQQLMRRSALRQIVAVFRLISAAIQVGFKEQAVKKSEYNAFVSEALDNAFDYGSPPDALLMEEQILTSKGTITPVASAAYAIDKSANTITATYTGTSTAPGQSATDLAVITAYNIDLGQWTAGVTANQRNAASASIGLPTEWLVGHQVRVYLSFYNPSTGKSDTSTNDVTSIVA